MKMLHVPIIFKNSAHCYEMLFHAACFHSILVQVNFICSFNLFHVTLMGVHTNSNIQLPCFCLLLCTDCNISDGKRTQHGLTRPSAWESFVFFKSDWLDWTAGGSAHKHTRWSWKDKNMLDQNEAVKQFLTICKKETLSNVKAWRL